MKSATSVSFSLQFFFSFRKLCPVCVCLSLTFLYGQPREHYVITTPRYEVVVCHSLWKFQTLFRFLSSVFIFEGTFLVFFSHRIILCLDRASTSVSVCGFFYRQWIPGIICTSKYRRKCSILKQQTQFAWKLTSYNALKGWLAWTIEKAMNFVETFLWSSCAIELVIVWYNSNIAWIK